MAKAHAGNFPGSSYAYTAVNQFTRSGKPKSVINENDMEWDALTGWHFARSKGWRSKLKKGDRQKVTLMGSNGIPYQIYVYEPRNKDGSYGFNDHIGFRPRNNEDALAYAQVAFDESRADHDHIEKQEGCGHITMLEYATRSQVLRVTFKSGSICLFFRVPDQVAGTLFALARSKATQIRKGVERHVLGITFWDLVRIRGSRVGARYNFEYEKHVDIKTKNKGRTRIVKLNTAMAKLLMKEDPKKFQRYIDSRKVENGYELGSIAVPLDEGEYAKYFELLKSRGLIPETDANSAVSELLDDPDFVLTSRTLNDQLDTSLADYEKVEGSEFGRANGAGYFDADFEENDAFEKAQIARSIKEEKYGINTIGDKARSLITYAKGIVDEALSNARATGVYREARDDAIANGLSEHKADIAGLHAAEWEGIIASPYKEAIDFRTGKMKEGASDYTLRQIMRAGGVDVKAWNTENNPAKHTGKIYDIWTPTRLKEFANASIPNHISLGDQATYKRFIAEKDWVGALNFLKSHSHTVEVVNKKTGATRTYRDRYAGEHDELALDD